MANGSRHRRKISSNNQVYLPTEFRVQDRFYIPEPGTIYPTDELRLYPQSHPPEIDGELDGEQIAVNLTNQGQLTLPRRLLDKTPLDQGDHVWFERHPGWYVSITAADDPDEDGESD